MATKQLKDLCENYGVEEEGEQQTFIDYVKRGDV